VRISKPLFPTDILPEEVEEPQPEQPTTDKAEPSAKGEKCKRKKSKSEKKKKSKKKKNKEKMVEEAHLVTSDASHKSPANKPNQRISETHASEVKPEPSDCILASASVCRRVIIHTLGV
jgi:hypothetical protein